MGSLNVVKYSYTMVEMMETDVAADLQTKLRVLTGGGDGDGSKIRGWHGDCIHGNWIFIVCYEG